MSATLPGTLGIDFGTSNSAVAWAPLGGPVRLLPLEGAAHAMPTAVFFNSETLTTHVGREAVALYLAGHEGRLMRSLKSLLGSALVSESTVVNQRRVSFLDIITAFLQTVRERVVAQLGGMPERVVLGRPVHFVDGDPVRDAQAQASLAMAAEAAGWGGVSFQLEPMAAALDYERQLDQESLVLVVDVGGGTSDFTLVRLGPGRDRLRDRSADVLATTGVHIGGTDFDQRLSLADAMPLLGYRHLGPEGREVPSRLYFDLATWHLIQWLYQPKALAQAQSLRTNFSNPVLFQRLMRVLTEHHGHHIAHAVEQAKIACSGGDDRAVIDLSVVEAGLTAPLSGSAMATQLAHLLAQVVACARLCVDNAGLAGQRLDAIYLTGGSSALRPFQAALEHAFPGVPLVPGDLFGSVASGLVWTAPPVRG